MSAQVLQEAQTVTVMQDKKRKKKDANEQQKSYVYIAWERSFYEDNEETAMLGIYASERAALLGLAEKRVTSGQGDEDSLGEGYDSMTADEIIAATAEHMKTEWLSADKYWRKLSDCSDVYYVERYELHK